MKFKALLIAMLFLAGFSYAGIVPVTTARTVAKNVYYEKANDFFKITLDEVSFSDEITISNVGNTPIYYVFNLSASKGFVIISAENATIPVLGYSFEKNIDMNNLSPEYSAWVKNYTNQIEYVRKNNVKPDVQTTNEWNYYLGSFSLKGLKSTNAVAALISTTWDQGCYYNGLCPSCGSCYSMCSKMPTGCVATAMAQIMKYHAYPAHGYSSHTYAQGTANFASATYAWANMPNSLISSSSAAQKTAVATIMFHCGVSVDMSYTSSGSGAYMADAGHALSYYFTYNALYDARYYHSTDAEWNALLKTDLDNSRPILYAGTDSDGTGGHAWVCDGYQGAGNDYFHFNFGWSGDGNGYFYLNDITPGFGGDYSYNSEAVLNIYPSPAVTPAASFTSNKTNILVNEYIILTNTSTNNPLDYNWVVTPSTGFTYVGSTSPTAKTPYIKFTSPGDYTIALTAINAAGSNTMTRANYIHVGASGIESNTENSLSIYPNPTKGLIHISLGNMGNSNVEISVYNYIGAFVKNVKVQNIVDNNITIDLSDQSQGIYYISVKSEDQIITRKITLVN